MNRPLLITDCDEVLLHMVAHFDDWLGEAHKIRFAFETGSFGGAMTEMASGEPVPEDRVWPLLDQFFRQEMHRQTLVPGAIDALGRIGEVAAEARGVEVRGDVRRQELRRRLRRAGQREGERSQPRQPVGIGGGGSTDGHGHGREPRTYAPDIRRTADVVSRGSAADSSAGHAS